MSAHRPIVATGTRCTTGGPGAVPERARRVAARLSALFERDQRLCEALNDAGRELSDACERLCCPGTLPAAAADRAARAGWRIHRAFCAHQQASEQRRQLAVDVGELSRELEDALCAVGHATEDARHADVHALAAGKPPTRRRAAVSVPAEAGAPEDRP
jgi:hypothetical protein